MIIIIIIDNNNDKRKIKKLIRYIYTYRNNHIIYKKKIYIKIL